MMEPSLSSILDSIDKGSAPSCYLIWGDDEFRVADALSRILSRLLPEGRHDLNLVRFDGEREDVDAIVETLLIPSLLGDRKVVVVQGSRLFASKGTGADIIESALECMEGDPPRAAHLFMTFLEGAGWKAADLRDGGWKKISDAEWRAALGGEPPADVETRLPRLLALCDELNLSERKPSQGGDRLEAAVAGGLPRGNYLILTAQTVDRRKKIFKTIADAGAAVQFSKASQGFLQKDMYGDAMQRIAASAKKKISRDAMAALGVKTGFDLAASAAEVEKLISFVGERPVVEKDDVHAVVTKTKEETVFNLISAVMDKNTDAALSTVRYLRDQGVHYLMILAMIAREMRLLIQGKMMLESEALSSFDPAMSYPQFQRSTYPRIQETAALWGKKGSLPASNPYVVYTTLKRAPRFSLDELIEYHHRLAVLDISMKTSGIEADRALERFIIDMCR